MNVGPLLGLLGPLEAHVKPFGYLGTLLAISGPSGPLEVLLESPVAPSIPFEALQGSLDLGIWVPAWALGRPLLRLFGPLWKSCLIFQGP